MFGKKLNDNYEYIIIMNQKDDLFSNKFYLDSTHFLQQIDLHKLKNPLSAYT